MLMAMPMLWALVASFFVGLGIWTDRPHLNFGVATFFGLGSIIMAIYAAMYRILELL